MIAVKHFVSQVVTGTYQIGRNRLASLSGHLGIEVVNAQAVIVTNQYAEQVQNIVASGGFIQCNTYRAIKIRTQVESQRQGLFCHAGFIIHQHGQRIEVRAMLKRQAFFG